MPGEEVGGTIQSWTCSRSSKMARGGNSKGRAGVGREKKENSLGKEVRGGGKGSESCYWEGASCQKKG